MTLPIPIFRQRSLDLSLSVFSSSYLTPLLCRRHQSSYRRTRKRLRVKPNPSFSLSPGESEDHIIHNPPSSAPSIFQTPTKFLPPNDVRRKLRSQSQAEESRDVEQLPVLFKNAKDKKHYLTAEQIEEVRQLRQADPMTWSRNKLAKKFNCNPVFIGTISEASPEKKAIQKQVLETIKSRWGKKRTMAREDRQLRREVWAKDR